MSRSLDRLLRLRGMTEELSRIGLAREAQKLAVTEGSINASTAENMASRKDAFRAITEQQRDDWLVAEGSRELADWRIRMLKPRRDQQKLHVEEFRHVFLERRKEKRQVEEMLEAQREAAKAKELHRLQAMLDDWYERSKVRKHHPRP